MPTDEQQHSDNLERRLQRAGRQQPFDEEECRRAVTAAGSGASISGGESVGGSTVTWSPRRLGRYELIMPLCEQTGQGLVWRAREMDTKRPCAVKVLRPDRDDGECRARFQREIDLLVNQLKDPNIVLAYGGGIDNGDYYLVMELLQGQSLADVQQRLGMLSVADACEILCQSATALSKAHAAKLVHRDVKPANLFLTRDGIVKLLDLGLARVLSGPVEGMTVAGTVMGTAETMAPEQIDDPRRVDGRADLYALGCVGYRLLTGEFPYKVPMPADPWARIAAMLEAHRSAPLVPIRNHRRDVPEELARVIERMLARPRQRRFASAEEVIAGLRPFVPTGHDLRPLVPAEEVGSPAPVPAGRRGQPDPLTTPVRAAGVAPEEPKGGHETMPYSAPISRANPTCFLFLIDQSSSMLELMGGAHKTKAESMADAINDLLYALWLSCQKGQTILDRFLVGVLGYGLHVAPALGGALAGRDLVPISEVARNRLRMEQRPQAGGVPANSPVWLEPLGQGKTPMCTTLELARNVLAGFLAEHPTCFPPVVINITDGKATDGDPAVSAAALCQLSSTDGNVLLFNAHISTQDNLDIMFPDSQIRLPDSHARRLFRMSSLLPAPIRAEAEQAGYTVSTGTRGFAFNANLKQVVQFLRIGTLTAARKCNPQ